MILSGVSVRAKLRKIRKQEGLFSNNLRNIVI